MARDPLEARHQALSDETESVSWMMRLTTSMGMALGREDGLRCILEGRGDGGGREGRQKVSSI